MVSRLALVAVSAALTFSSCTVVDTTPEGPPTPQVRATTAPTTSLAANDQTPSVGLVTVGGESFDLDFECFAPGAGEILAVGLGRASDGRRIEAYLQAFLGSPYMAIAVIDDTTVLYEAAVDRPLNVAYNFDTLRVDDVALVTDLNLETGIGTDAGLGTIVVECRSYAKDLPAGFSAGG